MKKILTILCVIGVLALMILTTPDKKAHKDAMMQAVEEYVEEEAESKLGKNILADLSSVLANNSIKALLNYKLKFHNYFLFTTTTMRVDGEEQLMSVGLLKHVFTFDKDMLKERLEKAEKSIED